MGNGASVETARGTVTSILAGKPADASDITSLEQAKDEIVKLRAMAVQVQDKLKEMTLKEPMGTKKDNKQRAAVMDRGEKIVAGADYVPKVNEKPKHIRDLIMSVVTTNVLFASYAGDEQNAIVDAFELKEAAAGTDVITQGENGDYFYVVEKGSLDVLLKSKTGDAKKAATLGAGAAFGELALMYNSPRAATVKCADACTLWQIDRKTYREIIVYYKFLRNQQYQEFVKVVEIGGKKLGDLLKPADLEKFTVSLEKEVFEAGDFIIRQGNTGDQFYIISEGSVGVYKTDDAGKENKVATIGKGTYFGEKALLSDDVRAASCVAEDGKVCCLCLSREDFIDILGSFEDLVAGKTTPEDVSAAVVAVGASTSGFAIDCSLDTLEIRTTLGCGAFGRVKLCRHGEDFYALKCQAKRAITESGLQEHVLNELRVMRRIDHPFIAKLFSALQDDKYIYFVLELLQGGELFTHLRNRGKLSEQTARFYAASVVYAFSTLHAKKIAYRDLKPENLVMDTEGYCKLVDFGLAKQLLSGKTWTLCGTPDYLAPEIILNEGHDLAVDYWALGVLIFEMVVGAPPFYAEDPMEVYEKILTGTPAMPTFFTRNLSDLIKKLLRSQQAKRLGNTRGGTAAVIKHKWFSSFDWAGLEKMETRAPYKPAIAAKDDIGNFDVFDEGETPPSSDWVPDLFS